MRPVAARRLRAEAKLRRALDRYERACARSARMEARLWRARKVALAGRYSPSPAGLQDACDRTLRRSGDALRARKRWLHRVAPVGRVPTGLSERAFKRWLAGERRPSKLRRREDEWEINHAALGLYRANLGPSRTESFSPLDLPVRDLDIEQYERLRDKYPPPWLEGPLAAGLRAGTKRQVFMSTGPSPYLPGGYEKLRDLAQRGDRDVAAAVLFASKEIWKKP